MVPLVGTVLVTSLLGSLHCAGMCGGFVAFYAGSDASRGWRRLAALGAYNGGRLVTYALLGAAFGAMGAAVDLAGSLAGITRTAFLVAAILMIGWGVWLLLQALNVRVPALPAPAFLGRAASRAMAGISGKPPVARALILGLASTLLPCGWLYAFAILAAGTGSAVWGAVVMAAFWAGTVPVMAALGAGLQAIAGPLRRHLPAITAVALIVVGIVSLWGRTGRLEDAAAAAGRIGASIEQRVAGGDAEVEACH
jgi:sulfite exporter TauE/SafE